MKFPTEKPIQTTTVTVMRGREVLASIAQLLERLPDGHPGKPTDALPYWVFDLHDAARAAWAVLRGDMVDEGGIVLDELTDAIIAFEKGMPVRDGVVQERGRPAADIATRNLHARLVRKMERAERKAEKKTARKAAATAGLPADGLPN